jgi:1,4-alpha-glucan branching enzyme
MVKTRLDNATAEALAAGRHEDVFSVLGVHQAGRQWVARAFVPGAETLAVLDETGGILAELTRVHEGGAFEGPLKLKQPRPLTFRAENAGGSWDVADPYSHGPVLGPLDDYYAAQGTHLRLYDRLGAHLMSHEGRRGTHFAVWAPNARRVSVIGDFNGWDGRLHVMRKRLGTGIFEIFLPGVGPGALYKFEIIGQDGMRLPLKSDPFAFAAELRPGNASRVADISGFAWTDHSYLSERARRDPRRTPMSIYEVHAGSWKRKDGNAFLTYEDLADDLIPYVKHMGFTHIEFLPLSEHPFDPSWGYQPTGLFAPTSRFGDPAGFARFVDRAHAAGIGVILDWVPAHFPTDEFGLARFDGTALYEHEDPRRGFHPDWNTAIYNFGRTEVQSFLINNALFWLEVYHIDGLRVDAVASMLYLDYSRKQGEWLPNQEGGKENLEAIAFLRRMNEVCYSTHPGIITIAEESTAFPGVSQPVYNGGLGFGFKWNMGFMHDTLKFMSRDPVHRKFHHSDITFGLLYAFSENFVLPLSHDEVVHGKGSLLKKMGGDDWAKFAGLRAYYALMWTHPGKKLLFMGQEFAPWEEWSEARSLDWHLTEAEPHRGVQTLIADLNRLYTSRPALHARDCEGDGFTWLIADDSENSVFAWCRLAGDANPIVMVANLTPVLRENHLVPLPRVGRWVERINTDAKVYWGSGAGNGGVVTATPNARAGQPASASVTLPPMATLILEWDNNGT